MKSGFGGLVGATNRGDTMNKEECPLSKFHEEGAPCPFCNDLTVSNYQWHDTDEVSRFLFFEYRVQDFHDYMRLHPDLPVQVACVSYLLDKPDLALLDEDMVAEANLLAPIILTAVGHGRVPIVVSGAHRIAKALMAGVQYLPCVMITEPQIEQMKQDRGTHNPAERRLIRDHVYANQTNIINLLTEAGHVVPDNAINISCARRAHDLIEPYDLNDFLESTTGGVPSWVDITGVKYDDESPDLWDQVDAVLDWFANEGDLYDKEVAQWYLVSADMARSLIAEGEVVLEYDNMFFWGRRQAGQSLEDDGVIHRIAKCWEES